MASAVRPVLREIIMRGAKSRPRLVAGYMMIEGLYFSASSVSAC